MHGWGLGSTEVHSPDLSTEMDRVEGGPAAQEEELCWPQQAAPHPSRRMLGSGLVPADGPEQVTQP